MALALRKAVYLKNITMLKFVNGRTLVTAKKTSSHHTKMSPKYKKRLISRNAMKTSKAASRSCIASRNAAIRGCNSWPCIRVQRRHFNTGIFSAIPRPNSLARARSLQPKLSYSSCNMGCQCPFPCGPCGCKGGCGCLPPPCNTPPRCLQYMTGYYYYPYGTWFSGPYHVTGTCAPVGSSGCPIPCPNPNSCPNPSPNPPCRKYSTACCICPSGCVTMPPVLPKIACPLPCEAISRNPSNNAEVKAKYFPFIHSPSITRPKETKPRNPSPGPYSSFSYCTSSRTSDTSGYHAYLSKYPKDDSEQGPRVIHRKFKHWFPQSGVHRESRDKSRKLDYNYTFKPRCENVKPYES